MKLIKNKRLSWYSDSIKYYASSHRNIYSIFKFLIRYLSHGNLQFIHNHLNY
jgi:hypothetical protein